MTPHVVMPPRRVRGENGEPLWMSSCTCTKWVRHADKEIVKQQMQSCRDKAKTPADSPDRDEIDE